MLKSGKLFRYTGQGNEAYLLERDFAKFLGVRFCVAVNSCSSAMFLALKALELRAGDKVLVPAFTFVAVPSAVVHAGGVPVLVESTSSYVIDLHDLQKKMKASGAGFLLLSHMRGHVSDMDAVRKLCRTYRVRLIEDAAHSVNATWGGKLTGTLGNVGCFSFQSYKMVNGGEGGLLATNDPMVAARAICMSGAYEQSWRFHPSVSEMMFTSIIGRVPAYNLRMNSITAAAIRAQLPLIHIRTAAYRKKYEFLRLGLSKSPFIEIPAALPKVGTAPDSMQFNLVGFSTKQAEAVMQLIRGRGVSMYVIGVHSGNARVFWNWKFLKTRRSTLPRTAAMLMRICDFRISPRFTKSDLSEIIRIIVESIGAVKSRKI